MVEDLFRNIARTYPTYEAFIEALVHAFNEVVLDLPPGYTYLDAAEKGRRNGFWLPLADGGVHVCKAAIPVTT